jgi:glycosyltransferase involved in cell wall biosynthesis
MIAPASRGGTRPRVLVVGALPPPHHGCSVIMENLLTSPLGERFEILHLDIADRRGLENIGRLDAGNVWLAGVHGARFVRMLLGARPDLVYLTLGQNTWGFLRDALFLWPTALRGVPLVVHFQTGRFDRLHREAPAPVRRLVRALVPRAARGVVLGQVMVPLIRELLPADRIVIVPNAVPDLAIVPAPVRTSTRVRGLYLGNLIESKGYAEAVAAARRLAATGLDFELILAGGVQDAHAHARALQVAAGAGGRIRFEGPVHGAAKIALLRSSDFMVFPTRYESEGHPLVLLEGMAAGLPIVSTRHAAIPETVVEGETGLLVEPGDTRALAAAMRSLIEDPSLRERLGRAGRERYLENYTIMRWADRMGDVFEDALAVRVL